MPTFLWDLLGSAVRRDSSDVAGPSLVEPGSRARHLHIRAAPISHGLSLLLPPLSLLLPLPLPLLMT